MRARWLVVVLLLSLGERAAHAQSAPGSVQVLPPIVVSPAAPKPRSSLVRTARQRAVRPASPAQTPRIATTAPGPALYPTTPLSGSGIDAEKVPASVNVVDINQIDRAHSASISDALQQYVPGIVVNEVSGNPFQPNVQFRGFVASPVAGTPQGLAVYQNGVRVNEAFGDTVNWDLIPTAAI